MRTDPGHRVAGPLHVLLLCHFYPGAASTIIEHIHAFPRFSANRYYVLNNLGDLPWWLDLARFDAIVIHYSLVASYDSYISPAARTRIREFEGFKAAFVQDDYRWINDTVNAFAYMRINALFGLAGPDIIDQVYSPERLPGVRRETVLTGYVPEDLTNVDVLPIAERPIDVGYRARKLPAWIGSHTLQKWQIADRFLADAPRYGLKTDISYREEDRIYGEDWIRFVASCKAVLGTESGASVCDFTGEIQRNVEAHVKRDPDVSFETLRDLYFKDVDGKILMNVISPRCFEAASLRTLMIFYEGYYSGVLQPWRHYVPLKTDHSNMDEVVAILRHPTEAQAIVDRAYKEIALNPAYTFRTLVQRVDRVIAEGYRPREWPDGYSKEEFSWRLGPNASDLTRYARISAPDSTAAETLQPLLRKSSEGPAALPVLTGPPPHVIELALTTPLKLNALHLVWGASERAAAGGEVLLFKRGKRQRRISFETAQPHRYFKLALPPGQTTDRVELRMTRYHAGQQLCLHDLRVDGELHLAERARQAREKLREQLGTRMRWAISDLWMQLPQPARHLLRRHVRAIYDAIVGRPD